MDQAPRALHARWTWKRHALVALGLTTTCICVCVSVHITVRACICADVSACICTCRAGSAGSFFRLVRPRSRSRILSRAEEGAGLPVAYEPHILGSLGESSDLPAAASAET